jgi:hypothetical protein
MGDESLDAQVGGFGQSREKLVRQVLGKISEEHGEGGHGLPTPLLRFTLQPWQTALRSN